MHCPTLLERDHNSITIAWKSIGEPKGLIYNLEIFDNGNWNSLSSNLKGTSIRKKNLEQKKDYMFRVRSKQRETSEWSNFSEESIPLNVISTEIKLLDPPILISRDSQSITIQWTATLGDGYKLRFRSETDYEWQHVNSIVKDNVVKKKGLKAGVNYYFSVCPVGCSDEFDYSLATSPCTVQILSQYLKDLLPSTLRTPNNPFKIPSVEALAGKVVAIYFSAHWCGPCRSFTPKLSMLYNESKALNKDFEIIFCSADHNESDFDLYYKEMPFLAIQYDDDKRESFMGLFKVSGIPRLVILAPSGRIIVDNAVGQNITMATVDTWVEQGLKLL